MYFELCHYFTILFNDIPVAIYLLLIIVLLFGTILFFRYKGLEKGIRLTCYLLLLEYIFTIYSATVFFRPTMANRKYNFLPFWSYMNSGAQTDISFFSENLMNVVVFLPLGVLVGVCYREMTWKKVLMIGMCLSMGIEVLQLVFRKGFSEVDDVMHNTLGCAIGYGVWLLVKKIGRCSLNYCK